MHDWIDALLASDFMPHGHCYLWEPGLVWAEVVTNATIGAAYVAISATLAHLVRRIRDLPFQWIYVAFGVFIVTCGFTHFMDVLVIWRPYYWLDASIRVVTAIASLGTAILLVPLVPKAVAIAGAARIAHERGVALEQLNAELEALFQGTREALAEAIPQLVWTSDRDGAPDYYNQCWTEYLGEPILGRDWTEVIHPEDLPRVRERWQESLAEGRDLDVEVRIRRRDGAFRWFLARARPLRSGDRVVKWFGTCTDVHDQKLAVEERERLLARAQEDVRARDMFLAIAAHELRTPLTPLRLEIERLHRAAQLGRTDRLVPAQIEKRMSAVEAQILRLERLVTTLLDASRITTGRFVLEREELDLAALVREVVQRHAVDLERAGCTVSLDLEEHVVGHWDRLRVDQTLTNLLLNAASYGAGTPVEVTLRADADRVRLSVRDHGVGIAAEDQARIFERFERAVPERHAGGLGLGLWLVREIVDAHGGRVRVESALGRGATFVVELPRAGAVRRAG